MINNGSRLGRFGRLALGAIFTITLAACGGAGTQPDAASSAPSNTPSVPAPTPSANNAPVIEGQPPLTAKAGVAYSFAPMSSDADHDSLTFTISGMPAWATFDPATGALTGTPDDANVGQTGDIEIVVSDGKDQDSIGPFRINVDARNAPPPPATNSPPTISGSPATLVVATQPYIFIPSASDADHDPLSFSITNKPQWATFNTTTGELSGTPSRTQTATVSNIRITVSDGKASTSLPVFEIVVQAAPPLPNSAPVISGSPATAATVGTAYQFKPTATDADNDTLAWSIVNKPAWAAFSNTSGQLSGTPTAAGTFSNIRISVSDGKTTTALGTFAIVVSAAPAPPAANQAPKITGTPTTSVQAGTAYSFTPSATDADKADTLGFSITNKPSWASFSTVTGQLSGTALVGTYAGIVISVSDGKATVSLPSFTLTVTAVAVNKAPTISGSPATSANVGAPYSFTPSAADGDGDALTFSIVNKPTWATFSTTTGKLSGTPAAGDASATSGIVISVSDGKATVSLAAFSINVTAVATGSATVGWTPPTQNTDGTALLNLAGYHIYYGTSLTVMDNVVTITTVGITTHMIDNLMPGTWYFTVKAFTTDGTESSASNMASKTIN